MAVEVSRPETAVGVINARMFIDTHPVYTTPSTTFSLLLSATPSHSYRSLHVTYSECVFHEEEAGAVGHRPTDSIE